MVFTRETPHEAQGLTARTMEKVLAELRTIGIEEGETETTTYYVRPVYEWKKDSRVSKGYEGANELKIKTAKLHLLDSILVAVLKAGAKEIRYISFSCRDKQALGLRALQKATENARRRAEAIAAGLGIKVGSVVRVSDKRGTYPRPYVLAETSSPYRNWRGKCSSP